MPPDAQADAARSPRPAGWLAAGCAAGLALAAAATWARFAVERTLRLDTGTPAFLAAALVVGTGLTLAGACAFRLARRAGALRPGAALRWALLAHAAALPALALTSRDLYSNLAYGQLQLLGKSPYAAGPRAAGPGPVVDLVAERWADTPSAYGPVSSLVSRLAARAGAALGSPLWGGALAFKLAMLLCVAGALALLHAHARRAWPGAEGERRFALVALSPLLAWELSAQAHNDALLVLALAAFVWAAGARRHLLAVLALTAGTMAKLAAAPLLLVYLAVVARRSLARAAALALAAAALSALLVLPYWHGLETLRGPGATLGGDLQRHAHSLADLLALVADQLGALGPGAARVAALLRDGGYRLCWIGSTALCAALAGRALLRARDADDVVHDGLVLFLAYFLTAPWFQPWYATWALPLALAERDERLARLVAWYALLTVVQWALPLDPFSTVAVNAWFAVAWWRSERAVAPALDVAP